MQSNQFLSSIQSDNADTRFAGWRSAHEADPDVIGKLGEIMGSSNPGVAKAAREAITTMVHGVGKEPGERRTVIVKGLLDVAQGTSYSKAARTHAFRSLSLIAGEDSVPVLAKFLTDGDYQEEAAYAMERIPGPAADKAFLAAWRSAKDDFKPRILGAFGRRRTADAVPLCLEGLRSPNKTVAVAAGKALGRIGRKPAGRVPELTGLSEFQQTEINDSMVRFAEGMLEQGDKAEAIRVYKLLLAKKEPQWQCAAVIGLSKAGTADAAAAIFPLLKSSNNRVRITARKAWTSMAG